MLYIIEISNSLDSTIRIETVLSNEPLTKNSSSLLNGLVKLNDLYNDGYIIEHIKSVYPAKVVINSWDHNENEEFIIIKNLLIN